MSLAVPVWAYYTNSRESSHFVLFTAAGLKKGGGGEVLPAPAFLIDSDFLAPKSEGFLNKVGTFSSATSASYKHIIKTGKVMELSNSSHFLLRVSDPDVSHLIFFFSFAISAFNLQRQRMEKASCLPVGPVLNL